MYKLFQINTTLNVSATGRIAEQIGILAKQQGWEVWIAHGPRYINKSVHNTFQVCSSFEEKIHGFQARLYDAYGLGCTRATQRLIEKIKDVNPDIIHLHNIHGYYLDFRVLFDFLKEAEKPVVWTLHDCWPFTGHCFYFDLVGCHRWKTGCYDCPIKTEHPKCLVFGRTRTNYRLKKLYFTQLDNLTLVPVSKWIESLTLESFFKDANNLQVKTIRNGIDLNTFAPQNEEAIIAIKQKYSIPLENKMVMGCAIRWLKRKGFTDFFKLRDLLPKNVSIVLVGVSEDDKEQLPVGIIGVNKTQSVSELASLYSAADVFANPTYEDNYPTTNLEAIACGTPLITYDTGGSPEALGEGTGLVVEKGDIDALALGIKEMLNKGKDYYINVCRKHALMNFDGNDAYQKYLNLYNKLIIEK